MSTIPIHTIASVRTDLPEKFGVPRQSGLADLPARIVFEEPYRNADALRGIEQYSHLWIVWLFSEAQRESWSPTVRPPRLGGNRRVGVFATRSPFRPNPIALSSVRLERVERHTPEGPILYIRGADMMDGTPVLDIKPYLPYTDAHPDACGGFAEHAKAYTLEVVFAPECEGKLPPEKEQILRQLLAQDPRPAYQDDPSREYRFTFSGHCVRFFVCDQILTVTGVDCL